MTYLATALIVCLFLIAVAQAGRITELDAELVRSDAEARMWQARYWSEQQRRVMADGVAASNN